MLRLVGRGGRRLAAVAPLPEARRPRARHRRRSTRRRRAAGRDPAEVTRLLNVGADATVDDLVGLAVDDGVSTFIVMGDDEGTLRRFAGLFAEVRERVADARSASGVQERSHVRGPSALARRLPGIAYDDLPPASAARAVEPGDAAYGPLPVRVPARRRPRGRCSAADRARRSRRRWRSRAGTASSRSASSARVTASRAVPQPRRAGHRRQRARLRSRCSTRRRGPVRLGPGARWADVARALAPHGLAISTWRLRRRGRRRARHRGRGRLASPGSTG